MARISNHVICRHCRKEFRGITVLHLRKIHGYDGDHPVLDYKRKFGVPFALCSSSRKRISEAKEDFWNRRGQHWTRTALLAQIRRRNRAGPSLRKKRVPVRLYEAGRRYFGTWKAAVEKAGFQYEEATGVRRWSRNKVVKEIQKLARAKVPLDGSHIMRHYAYLHSAAIKRFPRSWSKALRAAGFNPAEHKKSRGRWDRPQAVEWMRRRIKSRRSLLAGDAPRDLLRFVYKRLGIGWTDFVESFGVSYPGIKKRRDWTRKKVLEELRRWKAARNRLNYRAVKFGYQALLHQAKKFFGSWDAARAAAGV